MGGSGGYYTAIIFQMLVFCPVLYYTIHENVVNGFLSVVLQLPLMRLALFTFFIRSEERIVKLYISKRLDSCR